MTGEEEKRLLTEIEKQYKWLMTKSPTIYMMDIAFDAIRKAVRDEAEQEPTISLDTYKQVARERDIAIEQLHELGYEFGEKIPTTQERQAESDRFDAAFQDGYNNGYAQARFDYEQKPTTKNDLAVESPIPHLEPDNCGNYIIQEPTTKNDSGVDREQLEDFARWVAVEIINEEMWEYNHQSFTELACRKLVKLGIMQESNGEYLYKVAEDGNDD